MIKSDYAETLFDQLYGHINGYSVSTAARAKSSENTERLLYGELPFETWRKIVDYAKPNLDGVFFDLGSGTGRVVMASYLLFNFRKSIGVELLEGLHEKALEVEEEFNKNIRPQIADHLAGRELQFIRDDIFKTDLREADFIFMNHPFKDGEIFTKLEEKFLSELKPGTKIATIIRSLKNPAFKQLGSQTYKFSWGDSTTHFCEV
jgi:hypothetical protein